MVTMLIWALFFYEGVKMDTECVVFLYHFVILQLSLSRHNLYNKIDNKFIKFKGV